MIKSHSICCILVVNFYITRTLKVDVDTARTLVSAQPPITPPFCTMVMLVHQMNMSSKMGICGTNMI